MRAILKHLADVCKNHPHDEKLLIAPSYHIGRQIGMALARKGTPWIGIRPDTPMGLACSLINPLLAREGIHFISDDFEVLLIEDICAELHTTGKMHYFGALLNSPGMHRALRRMIADLRLASYSASDIKLDMFESPDKAREIKLIFEKYEKKLSGNKLLDGAGMLRRALDYVRKSDKRPKNTVYMLMSDFSLTQVEYDFIRDIAGKKLVVLKHALPAGLGLPQRFAISSYPQKPEKPDAKSNSERLAWLFDVNNAPAGIDDDTVDIFSALGEINEVREVFRTIAREKLSCDEVEVVVSDVALYTSLFREMCIRLGIKATFADGIDITYARPARGLLCFLRWLGENYDPAVLREGLASGDIILRMSGGDIFDGRRAAQILRSAGIAGGRENYFARLDAAAKELEHKAKMLYEEFEDEQAAAVAMQVRDVKLFYALVTKLINIFPEPAGKKITFGDFCLRANVFLKDFTRHDGEFEETASKKLSEILAGLGREKKLSFSLAEAAERLAGFIIDKRIEKSAPRAGHIHVTGFRSGGFSGRARTFVIGLDSSKFPGKNVEDPLLLDRERAKLGRRMSLSREMISENLYNMARLLAGVGGKVTFGFSSRELKDDRELFPSGLVLQAYRLCFGKRDDGYSDLARWLASSGRTRGFIANGEEEALAVGDWWLWRLYNSGEKKNQHDSVLEMFPDIKRGELAESERNKDTITPYDGLVPSASGEKLDPRYSHKPVSCSRIEKLAACPYSYFLNYVLGIRLPEDARRKPGEWLDALSRGSLLHGVFCEFMRELAAKGEKPDVEKHSVRIRRLGEDALAEWRNRIIPPGESAYERRRREILHSLDIFLELESEYCRTSEPLYFEVSFGTAGKGDVNPSALDMASPAAINLSDGSKIMLRGRIDRIDGKSKNKFEIWDYKTGRNTDFIGMKGLDGGKHVQHALYAIAAEEMLRSKKDPGAAVTNSGYYFPTERGEGERVSMGRTDIAEITDTLSALFGLLSAAAFPSSVNKKDCEYCEYAGVCGGESIQRMKRKKENCADEALIKYWSLREK